MSTARKTKSAKIEWLDTSMRANPNPALSATPTPAEYFEALREIPGPPVRDAGEHWIGENGVYLVHLYLDAKGTGYMEERGIADAMMYDCSVEITGPRGTHLTVVDMYNVVRIDEVVAWLKANVDSQTKSFAHTVMTSLIKELPALVASASR